MKCSVTLLNSDCGDDGYNVSGNLGYTRNGFCLEYKFDGDDCSLTFDGETLFQKRRGKLDTDITYRKNAKTYCKLKDNEAGLELSLDVITYGLNYCRTESGVSLEIEYGLSGNRTVLRLNAEIMQERK